MSLDNTDNEGNEIKGDVVCIDSGSPVNSAGFGSGTPESQLTRLPQRNYYTRFDFSNEIVFATGHVNGRVRIWDVYTGMNTVSIVGWGYQIEDSVGSGEESAESLKESERNP